MTLRWVIYCVEDGWMMDGLAGWDTWMYWWMDSTFMDRCVSQTSTVPNISSLM